MNAPVRLSMGQEKRIVALVRGGRTLASVGAGYGVTPARIRAVLRRHGIPSVLDIRVRAPCRPPHPLVAEIERRRRVLGLTRVALSREAGVTRDTWRNWADGAAGIRKVFGMQGLERAAKAVGLQLTVEPIAQEPIQFVRARR